MNKIKDAFNSIKAEDNLKANTLLFLQSEMQNELRQQHRITARKLVLAFSTFVIILFSCVFSYNLYFTPSVYLDIDVNPSIELSINRFDRVIGAYAYNSDGEEILSNLNIKHKNCNEAVQIIMDIITENGYLNDGGLVSATLQTEVQDRENNLLATIENRIASAVSEHHISAKIDVFYVNSEIRHYAHDLNISPAKYLAILELQEVVPTTTVDDCRNHTIGEIRQMTQEHNNSHNNVDDNDTKHNQNDASIPYDDIEIKNDNHNTDDEHKTNNDTHDNTSSDTSHGNKNNHNSRHD